MKLESPLQGAFYMAGMGCKVFPLNRKCLPVAKGWQDMATEDAGGIKALAKEYPGCNWGVLCSGLLVIDTDEKEGRKGGLHLKDWADGNGVPKTFKVRTPTGGLHRYYLNPDDQPGHNAVAEGVDIKASRTGYVAAPGSVRKDGNYTIVDDRPFRRAPGWLIEKVAHAFIEGREGPAIEGDGAGAVAHGSRNNTFFRAAAGMRSSGFNQEEIRAALLALNERTHPPLTEGEVLKIARSAASYAPETALIAQDFGDPSELDLEAPRRATEIVAIDTPPRRWILKDRYIPGFISFLAGAGGSSKSTFAFLEAFSIVTGEPFAGFSVAETGPVWIYNTEDPIEEMTRRIEAQAIALGLTDLSKLPHEIHYSSSRSTPLTFLAQTKNGLVANPDAVDYACDTIVKLGVKVLYLDPLIHLHDADENDNRAMGKLMVAMRQITERTECAISILHHPPKAASGNAGDPNMLRGAGAFGGAARIVHTACEMTEADARDFGVEPHRAQWYIRIDSGKANMSAPQRSAQWFERKGIVIANGDLIGALVPAALQEVSEDALLEELFSVWVEECKPKQWLSGDTLYERLRGAEVEPMIVTRAGSKPAFLKELRRLLGNGAEWTPVEGGSRWSFAAGKRSQGAPVYRYVALEEEEEGEE
jgi:RecA-family ATPase